MRTKMSELIRVLKRNDATLEKGVYRDIEFKIICSEDAMARRFFYVVDEHFKQIGHVDIAFSEKWEKLREILK